MKSSDGICLYTHHLYNVYTNAWYHMLIFCIYIDYPSFITRYWGWIHRLNATKAYETSMWYMTYFWWFLETRHRSYLLYTLSHRRSCEKVRKIVKLAKKGHSRNPLVKPVWKRIAKMGHFSQSAYSRCSAKNPSRFEAGRRYFPPSQLLRRLIVIVEK